MVAPALYRPSRTRWPARAGRRSAGLFAALGLAVALTGCQAASAQTGTTTSSAGAAQSTSSGGTGTAGASTPPGDGAATAAVATAVGSAASGAPGSALAALSTIPVKGRAPMTGYSRSRFGDGWVDTDHNGCDTRNDVLARDLTGVTVKPGTHGCVVLTGTLADPYSGRTIAFQRGTTTSTAVQIDHVVALGDAWQTGAQSWDAATRTAFANDPRELLAVDGPLNEQKGDGDAATWLPPNKAYRCAYVARQVALKTAYGLWMTQAEKDASATVLATCPQQPLPGVIVAHVPAATTTSAAPTTTAAPRTPATVATHAALRTTASKAPAPAAGYYANCTAARAAGAAPLYRGQPGYRSALDRDGDGVACER